MHDVRTYIYIYIYKKHIYIYDEDFSQLYDKCGARGIYIYKYINILENATALGSRIPPHAVLLQVNDNTPVKLKIIFAI